MPKDIKGDVVIPPGVKSIEKYAFWNCSGLTSVMIPNTIKSIGEYVFYSCTSLMSVTFKDKTLEQVKAMDNYPWGIKDESVIKCESINKLDVVGSLSAKSNDRKRTTMKMKYTKRQIQESIKYWQKQLKLGNYKKLNEDVYDDTEDDYEEQRADSCKIL